MRKLYVFVCLLFCFFYSAKAQDFKIGYYHPKSGLPASIIFPANSNNYPGPENAGRWMIDNLHANSAFRLKYQKSTTGLDSMQHLRYKQYYGRFPVESGDVIMHIKHGRTSSLNGLFFPNLHIDTSIALSSAQALDIAMKLFPDAVFQWQIEEEEQILKLATNNPQASYFPKPELLVYPIGDKGRNEDFRLAYMLDVYVNEPHTRQHIYIDAMTGAVLSQVEQICTVDRTAIANTLYAGQQSIVCDSVAPDSFYLRETGRGGGIITYDVRRVSQDDSIRIFMDNDEVWNNVNAFHDEAATDAHWGAEMTYDFYKNVFNRDSYNDSGGALISRVHFGQNYNNAFWNGQLMSYGDGDGNKFGPFTSIDICGHELTHGVTQFSAALNYQDESGALNESFSDIFGKCIEHYSNAPNFDWIIGGRIALNGHAPLRDMAHPNTFSQPGFYFGQFFFDYNSSQQDQGGVHTNSGIQNLWFYLLCQGGSGFREDNGHPYKVDSIGMDKASRICYLSLTSYLYPGAQYLDACMLSLDAARSLYGQGSFEYNQVRTAWIAVGVISETSIADHSAANGWSLLPNPASNAITLSNSSFANISVAEVCDVTGRTIAQYHFVPGEAIDISSLSTGVYFVKVNDVTMKFVKE